VGGLITGSSSSLEKKGWFLPLGGALARLKVGAVKEENLKKGGRLNKLSFLFRASGVNTPDIWGSKLKKERRPKVRGKKKREGGKGKKEGSNSFLFFFKSLSCLSF